MKKKLSSTKKFTKKKSEHINIRWKSYESLAYLFCLSFFLINLIRLDNYSLTWDEPLHLPLARAILDGEYTQSTRELFSATTPFGVIAPLLSELSYRLLTVKMNLLSFDASYHLVSLFFAAGCLLINFFLTRNLAGSRVAFWATIFLGFLPRFIGHGFANGKDMSLLFLFLLSLLTFRLAVNKNSLKWFILAGISLGLALGTKINSFLLIPILFFWSGMKLWRQALPSDRANGQSIAITNIIRNLTVYLLVGALVMYLVWPEVWGQPIKGMIEAFQHFTITLRGQPVFYFGQYYRAGLDVPWHYSFLMLILITPSLLLVFAGLGFLIVLTSLKEKFLEAYLFCLFWFFIPMSKYFLPRVPVFDDVRQFIEVLPVLTFFTALGWVWFLRKVEKLKLKPKIFSLLVQFFLSLYLFGQIIKVTPFEMVYYNELTGGLKGAQGRFDLDFWGVTTKEAALWLNKNTQGEITVVMPFATHLLASYVPPRIHVFSGAATKADYVFLLNRPSFFNGEIWNYLRSNRPTYQLCRAGACLSWIFKNEDQRGSNK